MSVSNRHQTHKNSHQWYAKAPNRVSGAWRIPICLNVLLCLLLLPSALAQTVDEIIQKHIDALGSLDALQGVQSVRQTLNIISSQKGQIPIVIEWKRPHFLRLESSNFGGRRVIACFDGVNGWIEAGAYRRTNGKQEPRELKNANAEEIEILRMLANWEEPFVNYKDQGLLVELVGIVSISNIRAHKIRVVDNDGMVSYYYLDSKTLLTVRREILIYGKRPVAVATFSDYRRINGVAIAHFQKWRIATENFLFPKELDISAEQDIELPLTEVRLNEIFRGCDFEITPMSAKPQKFVTVEPKSGKIRRAVRGISMRDEEVRVALQVGPQPIGKDPEWLFSFYLGQSQAPVIKSMKITFEEPFIKILSELVCALYPQCLVTQNEPQAEQYDILLRPAYIGTVSLSILPKVRQLSELNFLGSLSISDSTGSHVATLRALRTVRKDTELAWSAANRAETLAERALSHVLQDLAARLSESDALERHLVLLAQDHEKPAVLHFEKVAFDDRHGLLANAMLDAGEQGYIQLTVRNEGPGMAYGVIVKASSRHSQLQISGPLALGEIAPGEDHEISLPIAANLDLPQEIIEIRIDAEEKRGYGATPVLLKIPGRRLRPPILEIIDVALNDRTAPAQGDGDGRPANGETIEAIVRIRNRGEGDAAGATVTMSSPAAEILDSPTMLPIIPVNQIREARVLFRIPRTLAATELELTFEAVETRGPQVAETELTETWPLRAKRPKVALTYRLYDGSSAASTGNRDGQINNGERVDVAIVAANRGELAAQGVEVAIRSPHPEIRVEPTTLVLGDLPAEAEAPEQRFVVDVPRGFGRDQKIDQLRLNLTVSQQEFRPQSEPVALPFQALRPNLRLDVESSPPVVQGKTGELVLAIHNTGTLNAEDVRVEVSSDVPGLDLLNDRDVPERRLEFTIGEVEPRGQAARIRLGLNVRRSVAAGEAPVEVTVVQKDFSAIRRTLGLTVVGEEPAVISSAPMEPPGPPAGRAPADARAPTISFLRYTTGAEVASEAIVLRFEVHHETDLVDLRLTRNGKQLTVGEPAQVTEQATGARTIRLAQYELPVQLDEGENRFEVIAVTGEGARGLRVLSIIRDRHAGEVWLAVVGVSDYLDPEVRDLAYADDDARAVHDYYRSRFKLPPDHLFLLVNEEATLRNVKSVLGTQLARHASHPDDTVIIYFAGHGQREADPSGLSADGFAKYLLPFDGDPEDPFSTALGMEEVAGIIRRLRAERVVFIVDSCFSGAAGGRTLFDPNRPTPRSEITAEFLERIASAGAGRVVLSASGANEVAEERAELGHGVFTHFLLRGLEGAADDNRDGLIDVDEIYRFVYRRVSEATSGRQKPERRAPRLTGEVLIGRASVLPQR